MGVFSFGENDVFGVYHHNGLRDMQMRMQKKLGFAVPIFFGRALTGGLLHRLFGFNIGFMPLRTPVFTVVGKPIPTTKIDQPSAEDIDKVHARYIEELTRVYNDWKETWQKEREKVHAQHDEHSMERNKVQQDKRFQLDNRGSLDLVE